MGSGRTPPPDAWHGLTDKQVLQDVYVGLGGPEEGSDREDRWLVLLDTDRQGTLATTEVHPQGQCSLLSWKQMKRKSFTWNADISSNQENIAIRLHDWAVNMMLDVLVRYETVEEMRTEDTDL